MEFARTRGGVPVLSHATGTAEELNKFDLFVREGRLGVCLVAPAARPLRR